MCGQLIFHSKYSSFVILLLYNVNGYVLDFTNNTFDVFTTASFGEALQTKDRLSKGKSLIVYLNEASDADRTKLLVDLFHHYEDEMEYEYKQDYEDFLWSGSSKYDKNICEDIFKM